MKQLEARLGICAVFAMLAFVPVAHADSKENPAIVYRYSLMELIGANFGPLYMMQEGKVAWDDARVAGYGKDLKALVGLNIMRGFPPGSDKGKTHAKPEIWKNMKDFTKKMRAMQREAAKLGDLAQTKDRAAIGKQIGVTGKACASCHDDYKTKEEGE
jgi:cytochrome c556